MAFTRATMLAGYLVVLLAQSTMTSAQEPLGVFNIEPSSISVSGFSSGGFMAAQLGIAYSSLFQSGFGVFAGGPYDCARDQDNVWLHRTTI
jgi:poly(3-hydroxybutyrate) depolymerase